MSAQKSSWHQGKGSRRWPIYTSAGRKKWIEWSKHAKHMVAKVNLRAPLAEVTLRLGKKAISLYLFDQEAAHRGFAYAVEVVDNRFHIFVEKAKQHAAEEAVAKLNPAPLAAWETAAKRYTLGRDGSWRDLRMARDAAGWHFARYREYAADRTDRMDYCAILFRNSNRTEFGIQEFFGNEASELTHAAAIKLAKRIFEDTLFRESLLSDDPDLPKMWRRH